jgi:hypothetical protein
MTTEEPKLSYEEAVDEVFCYGEERSMIEEAFDDLRVEQLAHLTEALA